jgi:hypothetical protein
MTTHKLLSEEELEDGPAPSLALPSVPAEPPSAGRDRINNVTQKENAMLSAGVTRRKVYSVIRKLLDAKKYAEQTDASGNVRWELVDDLEKQRQGVELSLKTMGDMIEHRQVNSNSTINVTIDGQSSRKFLNQEENRVARIVRQFN